MKHLMAFLAFYCIRFVELYVTNFIYHKYNFSLKVQCQCTKMKFFIRNVFSRCDQICIFLPIWSHLLKKSLMENFIFCEVYFVIDFERCILSVRLKDLTISCITGKTIGFKSMRLNCSDITQVNIKVLNVN